MNPLVLEQASGINNRLSVGTGTGAWAMKVLRVDGGEPEPEREPPGAVEPVVISREMVVIPWVTSVAMQT